MKKSNWILLGIVVLLIVLGLAYSIPVREGAEPQKPKLDSSNATFDGKKGTKKTLSKEQQEKNKNDPKKAQAKTASKPPPKG